MTREEIIAYAAGLLFVGAVYLLVRYGSKAKAKVDEVTIEGLAKVALESVDEMSRINKAHARGIVESQAALAANQQKEAATRAALSNPSA